MRAGCRQRCEALSQALTPKMRAEAPALGPPLGVHSEQVLRGQSATLGEMTAQYHDVRCHLRRDPKVVGVGVRARVRARVRVRVRVGVRVRP